jgi:hypothetical protein
VRALIVHVGGGLTRVLLASTRREDSQWRPGRRRPQLFEEAESPDEPRNARDRLYVMHDQSLRNGADLSLHYIGQLRDDLREGLLSQAAEALRQFGDLAEASMVTISASLLDPDAADPTLDNFEAQLKTRVRVLQPKDEALWLLRGVRGLHPGGHLACASIGHWRTLLAFEEPGRAPRLQSWDVGTSRLPQAEAMREHRTFDDPPTLPAGTPLLLTGEHAWLLAALRIGLCFHDLDLLDEVWLDDAEFLRLDTLLGGLSIEERNLIPMVGQRGDSLLDALRLFRLLMSELHITRAQICSRGLVHGLASHLFYEGRNKT